MCIDLHQTGYVGEGSDRLQLIKFWQSCTPGKGVFGGRKFLAPPNYYSQRAVFASLWALFHSFSKHQSQSTSLLFVRLYRIIYSFNTLTWGPGDPGKPSIPDSPRDPCDPSLPRSPFIHSQYNGAMRNKKTFIKPHQMKSLNAWHCGSSGGQTGDRAVVREELMGSLPAQTF